MLLLKLFQLWQRKWRTYALHAWRVIFFYFKQTWVVIWHPSFVSHQTKCKVVCQTGLVKRARFPVSKLGFKENQCSFKSVSSQCQFSTVVFYLLVTQNQIIILRTCKGSCKSGRAFYTSSFRSELLWETRVTLGKIQRKTNAIERYVSERKWKKKQVTETNTGIKWEREKDEEWKIKINGWI